MRLLFLGVGLSSPGVVGSADGGRSKRGRVAAWVVGCGCLGMLLALLVVVGLLVLGASLSGREAPAGSASTEQSIEEQLKNLKVGEELKVGGKAGETKPQTYKILPPKKARKVRAKKAADTFIGHLSKGKVADAWKMSAPSFQQSVGTLKKLERDEQVVQLRQYAPKKNRYLYEHKADTLQDQDGRLLGVQSVVYEYRRDKERRAMQCTVKVLDSELVPRLHSGSKKDDFKVISINCAPIYIAFRRSWGDRPTGDLAEFARYGAQFREQQYRHWPVYDSPPDAMQAAADLVTKLRDHIVHGRLDQAIKFFAPDARTQKFKEELPALFMIAGKEGLKKAQITCEEWQGPQTYDAWLMHGLAIGSAPVTVAFPAQGKRQTVLIFIVEDRFDSNKPANKALESRYVSTIQYGTRHL